MCDVSIFSQRGVSDDSNPTFGAASHVPSRKSLGAVKVELQILQF